MFSVFQKFHRMVQTQFNASIKILRSNNRGEYLFNVLCTILHQSHRSAPKQPSFFHKNGEGLIITKESTPLPSPSSTSTIRIFSCVLDATSSFGIDGNWDYWFACSSLRLSSCVWALMVSLLLD